MSSSIFEAEMKGNRVTLWHQSTPWLRYVVNIEHSRGAWRYRTIGDSDHVSPDFATKNDAFAQLSEEYLSMVAALQRGGFTG